MSKSALFGRSMSLIETAGIFGDCNESLEGYGNQFTIPLYGYDICTGGSILISETKISVREEYTPPTEEHEVFFFDTCVVYNTPHSITVVRDVK